MANSDFLTEFLFSVVLKFYDSIREILYKHDELRRCQSTGPGMESYFNDSVPMRKHLPK